MRTLMLPRMHQTTKESGMSTQLPAPAPRSYPIQPLRSPPSKFRDRIAEQEEELRSKDRTIRELMAKLREEKEDRAYYQRLLEDKRAMSVRETEAALINAVSAQLDLLPSKLKPLLAPAQRADMAVSTDEASCTS
ncbi:hypothetical protein FRC01_012753 [Tulasnella sp. 417]|nr:hypothetical protein FRC01_012753 [Tulasnella sp. 417]